MMGLFVIGMLVVFLATGAFAVQNPDTAQFHLLSYSWSVPMWVPTLVGVGAMAALLFLAMTFATVGGQLMRFGYHRQIGGHRATIAELEDEVARLRDQLAAARGSTPGRPATTTPRPNAGSGGSGGTGGWRTWLRPPGRTTTSG
jgi:uncharacterized integral membrane protein